MQTLLNFFTSYLGFGILIAIAVVLILWSEYYKSKTKELSVKYAKLVVKKYKESRAKVPQGLHNVLFDIISAENPTWSFEKVNRLEYRIRKNWFKSFTKEESKTLRTPFEGKIWSVKRYIRSYQTWFPKSPDKNTYIYFLKLVISQNSK